MLENVAVLGMACYSIIWILWLQTRYTWDNNLKLKVFHLSFYISYLNSWKIYFEAAEFMTIDMDSSKHV